MIRLVWWMFRALVALAVLGAGFYLGGPYLLARAGRYLITQDPLDKADMVLVLSGQPYLRVPEAARIYHQALAPKILLVNAPRPHGQEELLRLGLRYPDSLGLSLQILKALHVPREAILTIPEPVDDLQVEAGVVSRFLADRSVKTLVIVTSKVHSTRARQEFAAGLGPKVNLVIHPVPTDPFDPSRWWKDRTNGGQVVWEYARLVGLWWRGLWREVVGEAAAIPPPIAVR